MFKNSLDTKWFQELEVIEIVLTVLNSFSEAVLNNS